MRNYVNFRGRARRREFWMFTLFNTLVYLLLLAVGLVLLGAVIYKSVAEGGYLRLWLPESENASRLDELRAVIRDDRQLRVRFDELYDDELRREA